MAEAFLCDSNDAVEFKLVRAQEDLEDDSSTFKPEMSNQIFGDKECIFGYIGLKVKLYYTAAWLNPYLGVEYSKSVDLPGLVPDNIPKLLDEKLEIPFERSLDVFTQQLKSEEKFKPFGELMHTFKVHGENNSERCFEVYMCDTSNKDFLDYHSRLQTFLLWFVDAASFIDTDDDRWRFFLVFEKYRTSDQTMYAIAGYATVYEYYAYPENLRPRISQVLILPPFQSLGLCAQVVSTIYKYYLTVSKVTDITVEDPSEDFQRVRDFVDCSICAKLPSFSPQKLKEGYSRDMEIKASKAVKLSRKQVRRVYEILYLKSISVNNEEEYKQYRLTVKRRLNLPFQKQKKYVDRCKAHLTPEEVEANLPNLNQRMAKLQEMYSELEEEYKKVISRLENHQLDYAV